MSELKKESHESITRWAEETFGPATIETMVARAAKEFKELEEVVARGESPERVAYEAADVMICLARVIVRIDPQAIDRKMAINRARQWHVVNGVGQHIVSKGGDTTHEQAEKGVEA